LLYCLSKGNTLCSLYIRAYLIYDGRIIVEGSAQHLLEDKQARELYLGKDFTI
jgi:lipopolysaccharide export system ATP-binding protein